jgi:copper chaperone NosL
MKAVQMSRGIQVLLIICSMMLILVLFKPIWRIELAAPQYPEGLAITINANGLGGDVAIINGLNHYIGMKTLHNEDFIEFKILPYIISVFALFFLVVAITRRIKLMNILFFCFLSFGTIAMIDFWKWEYDYGHNLDPSAAIIVPGMAYQPPLIGYKQLLNFAAYSIPDIGGWLFIIVGMLLLSAVIIVYRNKSKAKKNNLNIIPIIATLMLFASGCSTDPEPIKIGSDNCHYCKMTITDNRYAAEIVTTKGKVFKYDDSHCLLAGIADHTIDVTNIKYIYFTDFCAPHNLVKAENSFYIKSDELKAPMGGNVAAFSSPDSLKKINALLNGTETSWSQINPIK